MDYQFKVTPLFENQFKRLVKKFPSLRSDIKLLRDLLADNPFLGDDLGKNCYKIRLSIKSKGKGKRGGARVITHCYIEKRTIFFLSIYDKSEKLSISDSELTQLLKYIHD